MSVLKLVTPYLWALGVALAVAVALTVAFKKWPPKRRFLARGQTWLAFLLVAAVIVNLICVGPMSTMLSLVSGSGAVTEETIQEAREIATRIAEEGVVLLENDGLLPLSADAKVNVFGWSSTNPYYGGTGSGGFSDKFKTTTLLDSLAAAGLEYNPALSSFYTAYRADRPEIGLFSQDWTLPEPPLDTYSDDLLNEAKDFSNTALLVLSRSGGEGADLPKDVNARDCFSPTIPTATRNLRTDSTFSNSAARNATLWRRCAARMRTWFWSTAARIRWN